MIFKPCILFLSKQRVPHKGRRTVLKSAAKFTTKPSSAPAVNQGAGVSPVGPPPAVSDDESTAEASITATSPVTYSVLRHVETMCSTCGCDCKKKTMKEQGVQYDTAAPDHTYSSTAVVVPPEATDRATQTSSTVYESVPDSQFRFFTGLTKPVFEEYVSLATSLAKASFLMPVEDQIMLTLMRLRMGSLLADLAFRFHVSTSVVSRVFSFWIPHLAQLSRKYLMFWLPTDTIRLSLPDVFEDMPRTTCIIDCFEIFCDRPRNLLRRGKMFSFYKSHNTVKVLHAVAPNGFIMFVSKAYGGRASDRYMTANSGLLDHLDYGDEVLADRGFTIADILPIGVELALPSFTKGKQLAARDVVVSRRLAKLRIHVERSIRRMKCFRILKYVPSSYLAKNNNLDHIVAAVAGLCNLQPALIKGPQLKET
ncbi:uncharacterized protein ISCGN_029953 [Ixodes scapularis]